MNEPAATPRFAIEDFVSAKDEEYEQYFDPQHFAALAGLEDENFWPVHRKQVILDHVERYFTRGASRLIDIGCGTGIVATHLNQQGFHVDYADAHGEALRIARERASQRLPLELGARRFMRVDATAQQVPGDYDGALLLDVLEHLPDDRLALGHVRDQLARTGREAVVVFTVPAFQFLWSPWDDMHHHKRRYTVADAQALASACGLQVLRATYFFAPLFFAAGAVKVGRTLARPLRRARAEQVSDLVEGKSHPLISKALLSVLSVERAWLGRNDLPCGTSVICVARVPPAS